MSELIARSKRTQFNRWQLLTSVCAMALGIHSNASATEDDHPTVWIELGAQLERQDPSQEPYAPSFLAEFPDSPVFHPTSPIDAQKQPRYAIGGEAKLTIAPDGTPWQFSAAVRYGRANNARHVHDENAVDVVNVPYLIFPSRNPTPTIPYTKHEIGDTRTSNKQSHAVLDFQVGRDVGLGLFGARSTGTINAGVRFAQFSASSTVDISARPDVTFTYKYIPLFGGFSAPLPHFHAYHATASAARSFRGAGPSLSWAEAIPLVGDPDQGTISLDLGLNGAVLFGRQKVAVSHHESGYAADKTAFSTKFTHHSSYDHPPTHIVRSRSVTVPNLGGSAGISFRFPNAKVSFGYRADVFFNAMDGGIDTHKDFDRSFHGPFATISLGLGG